MLEATGPELGRAAFMNTLVTSEGFDNGIYSPVAVHGRRPLRRHRRPPAGRRLHADPKQFKTAEQFVSVG